MHVLWLHKICCTNFGWGVPAGVPYRLLVFCGSAQLFVLFDMIFESINQGEVLNGIRIVLFGLTQHFGLSPMVYAMSNALVGWLLRRCKHDWIVITTVSLIALVVSVGYMQIIRVLFDRRTVSGLGVRDLGLFGCYVVTSLMAWLVFRPRDVR